MFGSGIYLSTDLGTSLGYSKTGLTWDRSSFGRHMSCVVLSEGIVFPTLMQEPHKINNKKSFSCSSAVIDHAEVKLHTDGKG